MRIHAYLRLVVILFEDEQNRKKTHGLSIGALCFVFQIYSTAL